jgi:predicted DNA-binding transcriptional regulator AlpA
MDTDTIERGLQLLNEPQAAQILCVSRACLRHWRAHDGGPPWVRIGERLIRYDLAELRRWISEQAGVMRSHEH